MAQMKICELSLVIGSRAQDDRPRPALGRLLSTLPFFLFLSALIGEAEARPVRVAYPGISIGAMVPALAVERKFFQQEGIQLELIRMSSNTGIAAMIAGDIDYTTASSTAIRAGLQGLPVKTLMFYVQRPYHAIVAQKGVRSIQELRGKTIATSGPIGAAYYVPRAILERYGLDPDKDVRLISVGGGDITERLLQLEKKSFDATVLSPPLLFYAEEKGYPIVGTATDFLDLPQQGIAASHRKLASNPEEAKKVIRVFLKSLQFIRGNREETVGFMRRWLKVDEVVAEKSYQMVLQTFSWNGEVSLKAVEKLIEITKREARGTKAVSVHELVDFGLLKEVRSKAP